MLGILVKSGETAWPLFVDEEQLTETEGIKRPRKR
jgi:hypothetical protein